MPDPINYSLQYDPNALARGLQTGQAMYGIQRQQMLDRRADDAYAQQQELQAQAQEQERARLQELATLREAAISSPTPQNIARLTMFDPKNAEAIQKGFSGLTQERQTDILTTYSMIHSAQLKGQKGVADQLISNRIEAIENSANPDQRELAVLKSLKAADASLGSMLSGNFLAAAMGPDKYADNFAKLSENSREEAAAQGKLDKTQAEIRDIDSNISWRQAKVKIEQAELGIKREANRIQAMRVALDRETNDIRRQELGLKIKEAEAKLDSTRREQRAEVEGQVASIDNALSTVDQLKKHPGLKGATGLRGALPNVPGTEAANANALIEQLRSQSFLAEVEKMKGLGALTEAEGKKLTDAVGSLDPKQDYETFKKRLDQIESQFQIGRDRVLRKYGADTGKSAKAQSTSSGW